MGKFNKFQLIVLASFVIFLVAGVAAFALYRGGVSGDTLPSINVWGTFPADVFDKYVNNVSNNLVTPITVKYTEKKASQFSQDFVSALARGTGPDAILIPAEFMLSHEDKLALIPYSVLSQRDFMDTYITEANIYLNQSGIIGFPFALDPLVMYWNRDMYDASGIATYPKYWDEFSSIVKSITVRDQNSNIRKSAIALGHFDNVTNAREIFGTLLMQSGNPVTKVADGGVLKSAIEIGGGTSPESAIKYFIQFADPANANYSWNRSMPASKSAFLSGTLATYFGFASELFDLRSKNPNLNFDVSLLPRPRTGGSGTTYGRMYGFSLVRTSPNLDATYKILSILSSSQFLGELSKSMYLPNVRRDVISLGSDDPYIALFNKAALVSSTWLDADPNISSRIFGDMIESISSGKKTMNDAIQDAGDQHDVALKEAVPSSQ
jgi:ABC-type glycerol-3-phosphate transport system substrate-binding protein